MVLSSEASILALVSTRISTFVVVGMKGILPSLTVPGQNQHIRIHEVRVVSVTIGHEPPTRRWTWMLLAHWPFLCDLASFG